VICTLLQPSQALGNELVRALLRLADIEVDPEAEIEVDEPFYKAPGGGFVYPDLRIRVRGSTRDKLILIENKIDDVDRENQLRSYAECAFIQHVKDDVTLLYLTPTGAPPTSDVGPHDWKPISYRNLAIAWRAVLARAAPSPRTEVLRLYLGTIVQEIWRVRLADATSPGARSQLVPYLRAALSRD
jgi:hypothetical protein